MSRTKKTSIGARRRTLLAAALLAGASWTLSASAAEVLVGAAASLTNAFQELAVEFQQRHPDTKVLISFAGSDALMQQIVNGAPMDVFASADEKAMDKAADAGMIETGSRHDFVRNDIVLIVPKDNPLGLRSVSDLFAGKVKRVALGNPASVPAGRYAKAALEKSGNWDAVKQREVLGQNVRQVLEYVARGEVDAGFVFATDAAVMPGKVAAIQTLSSPVPVRYPIALVKRDGRPAEASAFVDFVRSDEGRSVLSRYGFGKP